jgi:tryptophanase
MTPSLILPEAPLHPPSHQALTVRSLVNTTAEEREKILEDVEYNIFSFPAGLVICDYLSDSGTSAMTDVQWAASKLLKLAFLSVFTFERQYPLPNKS